MARVDPATLETEIARLPDLDIDELRRRWQGLYGRPAPKFFRRNFLARALAYQMRVAVHGGLSATTKRRLREIAKAVRNGNEDTLLLGPRIKPGTRLIRRWQDKTHTVTLIVNEPDAKTVRTIFRLYLELKNVRAVEAALVHLQLATKPYTARTGRRFGARPFSRGHIYKILSNAIYHGEIDHRGARHPGQHPAIIAPETWEAVQAQLRLNGHQHRTCKNADHPSLLAGLVFDERGRKFRVTHASKNGKRYIYYAPPADEGEHAPREPQPARLVAAAELDRIVVEGIAQFLTAPERVMDDLQIRAAAPGRISRVLAAATALAAGLDTFGVREQRAVLQEIVEEIVVSLHAVRLCLSRVSLLRRLDESTVEPSAENEGSELQILIACQPLRPRTEQVLIIPDQRCRQDRSHPSTALLKAVARGHVWFDELASGRARSTIEIAKSENVTDRYVGQLLELALLPPHAVDQLLAGTWGGRNQPQEAAHQHEFPSLTWHPSHAGQPA